MALELRMRRKWLSAEHIPHLGIFQLQSIALNTAQQVVRKFQVAAVAGGSIKLHERHLKSRMTCQEGALRRAEVLDYVVGKLYRRIQQSPASGCPVISDSGLDQVTQ